MTTVGIEQLTVLYDETCAVCRRARDWLAGQPTFLPVELMAAGSTTATERYAAVPWKGRELVVVSDTGQVWAGPGAYIMAMWATKRWRAWSLRLASRRYSKQAERMFHLITANRRRLGWLIREEECDWCENPAQ